MNSKTQMTADRVSPPAPRQLGPSIRPRETIRSIRTIINNDTPDAYFCSLSDSGYPSSVKNSVLAVTGYALGMVGVYISIQGAPVAVGAALSVAGAWLSGYSVTDLLTSPTEPKEAQLGPGGYLARTTPGNALSAGANDLSLTRMRVDGGHKLVVETYTKRQLGGGLYPLSRIVPSDRAWKPVLTMLLPGSNTWKIETKSLVIIPYFKFVDLARTGKFKVGAAKLKTFSDDLSADPAGTLYDSPTLTDYREGFKYGPGVSPSSIESADTFFLMFLNSPDLDQPSVLNNIICLDTEPELTALWAVGNAKLGAGGARLIETLATAGGQADVRTEIAAFLKGKDNKNRYVYTWGGPGKAINVYEPPLSVDIQQNYPDEYVYLTLGAPPLTLQRLVPA